MHLAQSVSRCPSLWVAEVVYLYVIRHEIPRTAARYSERQTDLAVCRSPAFIMKHFKDPVCGMDVAETSEFTFVYQDRQFHFCSNLCRQLFRTESARYARDFDLAPGDLHRHRRIAYFSMEVAVDERMPTYSGGLGVLAGDTLKSFADLRIPAVAVSLLYKNGYFEQRLDEVGGQQVSPANWKPADLAQTLEECVHVEIEGRGVTLKAWYYGITGATGYVVPLLLLDTNVSENSAYDRGLTDWLYGGDQRYRLAQEIILGIGGVRMLRALGFTQIERFHMNEGHAALLTLELLREGSSGGGWDFEGVRDRCVFTTHTPVAAGHDQFSYDLIHQVLGNLISLDVVQMLGGQQQLNMTLLGLNTSRYVNGVAKKHGEITREMFAGYPIDSITNGIHSATWTAEPFKELYDTYIPGWANDPFSLRYAVSIPKDMIWKAHVDAKSTLIQEVSRRAKKAFSTEVFTIGFARRATRYKRADLIVSEPQQLVEAANAVGPIQVLFAGKAHPRDEPGKEMIRTIVQIAAQLPEEVKVVYLDNHDLALGQLLTSGVDLWLNTPQRPLEASGTSGMKAAHNGVPSFSVLDGWWVEGHIEGVTGWSIGPAATATYHPGDANRLDAQDLYRKLRAVILPMYYDDRDRWVEVMRQTIAFNASFFNTHRMAQQYVANAYV